MLTLYVINKINFLARRKRAAQETGKQSGLNLPDFQDQEAVQRFFLQEVQLGEELLGQGDIENGIEHLSMAVAVCGQPHSLLGVLVIHTLRRRLMKYLTLIDIFFYLFLATNIACPNLHAITSKPRKSTNQSQGPCVPEYQRCRSKEIRT